MWGNTTGRRIVKRSKEEKGVFSNNFVKEMKGEPESKDDTLPLKWEGEEMSQVLNSR